MADVHSDPADETSPLSTGEATKLAIVSGLVLLVPAWIEMGVELVWFQPGAGAVPLWVTVLVHTFLFLLYLEVWETFGTATAEGGVPEGDTGHWKLTDPRAAAKVVDGAMAGGSLCILAGMLVLWLVRPARPWVFGPLDPPCWGLHFAFAVSLRGTRGLPYLRQSRPGRAYRGA